MKNFVIPTIYSVIDKFSKPIQSMTDKAAGFADKVNATGARIERSLNKFGDKALKVARNTAVAGLAIVAPLGVAANAAIKFEDRMSDVGKTTGMQGKELETFGQEIRKLSTTTRSSIDDLVTIGEIGGQLGVAKDELLDFTSAADKFNIALGADYSGGVEAAISSVGKLKGLFEDTRKVPIAESIMRTGSAINELGAVGAGTSENINDFMLRIGALPDAIKPSLTNTAALGTFFEEVGIDAQIASGGLSNFFLVASKEIGGFAAQMKMSKKSAADLLATDPTEFAKKFSTSLNGLAPEVLAEKLAKLKIGSQESIKVIGALGSGTQRLAELQDVAAAAFEKGNSLTDEAAKKNATNAAKLAIAKNNFENLSITIGTQLLPIIGKLLDKTLPIITAIGDWMNKHEGLMNVIIPAAAVIGGLLLTISGFATAIGVVTKAIAAWEIIQKVLNGTMRANPIGIIITIIGVLIAAIAWASENTEGWGATWDSIMKWMGAGVDLFVAGVTVQWLGMQHAFLSMVDNIVLAWKWGQNMIGNISDEQYAADKARIKAEQTDRVNAILAATEKGAKAWQTLNEGVDFQVRMKQGEVASPAMAKEALLPSNLQQQINVQSNQKPVPATKDKLDINIKAPPGSVDITKNPSRIPIKVTPMLSWINGQ